MTMQPVVNDTDDLALPVESDTTYKVDTAALAILNRSEVEVQIDAAHKHPRSIQRFMHDARTMATLNRETAESCIYSLPRGGKVITGPSVRLAEICASAYGNLHCGARVLGIEDKQIIGQGVAWDIQKNVRVSIEARRRITKKDGSLYDDDMIGVTGAAATSIALRNAIFRVIPRAYVDAIYEKAKEVAVGNLATFEQSRDGVFSRINKIGITTERILGRLGGKALADVGVSDLEVLVGLCTAMKDGLSPDEAFPPVTLVAPMGSANEGRKISLRGPKAGAAQEPTTQAAEPPKNAGPAADTAGATQSSPAGAGVGGAPSGAPTPTAADARAAQKAREAGKGKGHVDVQAPQQTAKAAPEPAAAAKPAKSDSDWTAEGDALWSELDTEAVDVMTAKLVAFANAGAPEKLLKPLRAKLAEVAKRMAEEGP
jgi:hypothetical protein